MSISSKVQKPDNFGSHNSVKLFYGFCSNFVDCGSFFESNSPDIVVLCETNLDGIIDSSNFSVELSSSNLTRFFFSIHGFPIYVKEGLLHGTSL